ncbi:MAG TPA: hypothetical protein VMH83_06630, partial [Candidatus Acidoferrum sp.]|nr:hypothetical protein [Candidatus Acidoferrum sp.]
GGQLTSTVISAGAGYGVPPEVFIPAPPPATNNPNGVGGIPASGFCAISSGTLSLAAGFSLLNAGAGYPTAFTVVALPSPTEPNIATGITLATIVFSITGGGSITGALCTNNGSALSNPNQITLSVAGAGTSGSLTANVLQTVTTASVSGVGTGFGTVAALLTTVGGVPVAGSIAASPHSIGLAWRPRPAQIGLAVTAAGTIGTQTGTIYDGGMFLCNGAPTAVIAVNPLSTTGTIVAPTLALTMGSRADIATMQPAA